jgi:hypothetical protein
MSSFAWRHALVRDHELGRTASRRHHRGARPTQARRPMFWRDGASQRPLCKTGLQPCALRQ